MADFVADASLALAWCFEDEAGGWTDAILERLRHGDRAVVPAHWPTEVLNGLLVAARRKRIRAGEPALFWDQLSALPIQVEPPLSNEEAKSISILSERHTAYDAAYLELALRVALPLGTLDADLRGAAKSEGVILL